MSELDEEQRSLIIAFCYGRSRLPTVANEYEMKFKIMRHQQEVRSACAIILLMMCFREDDLRIRTNCCRLHTRAFFN